MIEEYKVSKIDMHMHCQASDGTDTPEELYRKIKNLGMEVFSVTDHDACGGSLQIDRMVAEDMEAAKAASKGLSSCAGAIEFYRGIEFSCATEVKKCHILGYDYDPANNSFLDAMAYGKTLRVQKLEGRLEYLSSAFGIDLKEEDVAALKAREICGKPHLAQVLVDMGYGATITEVINRYLKHIPSEKGQSTRIPAEMAIRAIRESGGVAIWAHPIRGEGEKPITEEAFEEQLRLLMSYGLQGLECYYSRYTREEVAFLLAQAKKYDLLVSAGSDYHGKNKNISIGQLNDYAEVISAEQLSLLSFLRNRKLSTTFN